MTSYKITVVTVVNGDSEDLRKTYQSIVNQSTLELNHLIVNGADQEIHQEYFPFSKVINKTDGSLWEGMRNSLEVIDSEWVLYLNSGDCFYNNDAIKILNRDVELYDCDILYYDWSVLYPGDEIYKTPKSLSSIYNGLPFCHNATLVRLSVLLKNKFCFEHFKYKHSLDYGFFLFCYENGCVFKYSKECLVQYKALGYSDINRFGSVFGNLRYGLKSSKPIKSILAFFLAFNLQVVLKLFKNIKLNAKKCSKFFGILVEFYLWYSSKKMNTSVLPNNKYSLLIQLDRFSYSASVMLDDKYFSTESGLIMSRRYDYEDNVSSRIFYLEDTLSLKEFCSIFLKSIYSLRSCNTLSKKILKQIDSTILRKNAGKTLKEISNYDFEFGRLIFVDSICSYFVDKNYKSIDSLLVNDLSYIHNYSVFSNLLNYDVPVYYYSPAFDDNKIYLRKLSGRVSKLVHAATVDGFSVFGDIKHKKEWLNDWYKNKYRDNSYVSSRLISKKDFNFDQQDKKVIVIFSHVLYDANGAYGDDIFESMEDWIRETLKYYQRFGNRDIVVYLKEHPANRFKLSANQVTPERRIFESLNLDTDKFKLILNGDSVSTATILSVASGIITIRGTIALEAAIMGVPVLCAGSSRFTGQKFVEEASDTLNYFIRLNNFYDKTQFNRNKASLYAINWAYHLLNKSPLDVSPWSVKHVNGDNPFYEKK